MPLYREADVVCRARRTTSAARLPEVQARGPAALRGGRRRDDRGDPRRSNLPPHYDSSRPRRAAEDEAEGLQLRPAAGDAASSSSSTTPRTSPEPDQLKKAVIASPRRAAALVCIQGKLNYFNPDQNLLTRLFTTEYALWFDLLLPGLDARRADPARRHLEPLHTEVLRELGAWDPFNVTEDADLGVRLAQGRLQDRDARLDHARGGQLAHSATGSASARAGSRATCRPSSSTCATRCGSCGDRLRAVPVVPVHRRRHDHLLLNPIFWALRALRAVQPRVSEPVPRLVFYVAAASSSSATSSSRLPASSGSARREYFDLVPRRDLPPVYWGLMSVGAWKGFFQLFTKPFYWEKTEHGLVDAHAYLDGRYDGRPPCAIAARTAAPARIAARPRRRGAGATAAAAWSAQGRAAARLRQACRRADRPTALPRGVRRGAAPAGGGRERRRHASAWSPPALRSGCAWWERTSCSRTRSAR